MERGGHPKEAAPTLYSGLHDAPALQARPPVVAPVLNSFDLCDQLANLSSTSGFRRHAIEVNEQWLTASMGVESAPLSRSIQLPTCKAYAPIDWYTPSSLSKCLTHDVRERCVEVAAECGLVRGAREALLLAP